MANARDILLDISQQINDKEKHRSEGGSWHDKNRLNLHLCLSIKKKDKDKDQFRFSNLLDSRSVSTMTKNLKNFRKWYGSSKQKLQESTISFNFNTNEFNARPKGEFQLSNIKIEIPNLFQQQRKRESKYKLRRREQSKQSCYNKITNKSYYSTITNNRNHFCLKKNKTTFEFFKNYYL